VGNKDFLAAIKQGLFYCFLLPPKKSYFQQKKNKESGHFSDRRQ